MHTTSIPTLSHSRDPAFAVLPKQHRQHESTHQQPQSVESDRLPSSFTRQGEMMGFRDDYDSLLWVRPEPWCTLLHGGDYEAYAAGDIEGRRLNEYLQVCTGFFRFYGVKEMSLYLVHSRGAQFAERGATGGTCCLFPRLTPQA